MSGKPLPPSETLRLKVRWQHWAIIGAVVLAGLAMALLVWWLLLGFAPKAPTVTITTKPTEKPTLTTESLVTGYDHIWDVAFLPTKEMLFDERNGTLHMLQNGKVYDYPQISDVFVASEGGLLGLAVDPAFAQNHYIYTCMTAKNTNGSARDVRVVRWKLSNDLRQMADPSGIITGMPISSGRHSGCRVQFGPDGYLWVGTGDSATGGIPQDHKNLGGKVLRVDRDGKAAPGNLGGDFDARIYSYGHRNTQGLAFFPKAQQNVLGISVEHGSNTDDEVNLLLPGNFGWNPPVGPYTELGVKMTDKAAIPDAVEAIWSSGTPTIAPSGAVFLQGTQWKAWDGALAVAILKGEQLKIMTIDANNKVTTADDLFVKQFGRLRAATLGPDGALYICTDNGKADQIIRVQAN